MTDHKFADDEVIKALECCTNCICNHAKTDTECPLVKMAFCKNYLMKQSLALINRQKAEIERLERIRAELSRTVESLTNESLTNKCADCAGCAQWVCDCSTIESEAIKEFAENVKAIFECVLYFDDDVKECILNEIDELVKEMTEEQK